MELNDFIWVKELEDRIRALDERVNYLETGAPIQFEMPHNRPEKPTGAFK